MEEIKCLDWEEKGTKENGDLGNNVEKLQQFPVIWEE